jgi:hypothetical protein
MRHLIALVLASSLLAAGCVQSMPAVDRSTIAPTDASGQIEGRTTLGEAIPIPGRSSVLVPFAVETWKGLFQRDDPFQRDSVASKALHGMSGLYDPYVGRSLGGEVRWHNAVLHDLKSGEEWSILQQRGVISQWQVLGKPPRTGPRGEADEPFVSRALLFMATIDDTNKDGLLDDRDARVAILTDGDGRKPRIVTARNAQVWNVFYDPELDQIFLRVADDTNRDGSFTFSDEAMPMALALKGQDAAKPVISDDSLRRVRALLGPTPTGPTRPGP